MSTPRGQHQGSSLVPDPRAPHPTKTPSPVSTPSPVVSAVATPAAKTERCTNPWTQLLRHPISRSPSHRETVPPRTPYVPTHAASSFARTASPLVWRCKGRVAADKCSAERCEETDDSREDGEGTEVVDGRKDGILHSTHAPTDRGVFLAKPDDRIPRAASRPHIHTGSGHGSGSFSTAAPGRRACCSTTSSSTSCRTRDHDARPVKPRRGSSPCSGQLLPRPPSSTVKRRPSSIARCIGEYVKPSRKGRLADTAR